MIQPHTLGIGLSLGLTFALAACGSSAGTMQTVTLAAVDGSGQSGTATLTDQGNGSTSVALSTSGGLDTGIQLAHIFTGPCSSKGLVFTNLTSVQGGVSTTAVAFTLAALAGGSHYISIHNSANAAIIQACGQIQ